MRKVFEDFLGLAAAIYGFLVFAFAIILYCANIYKLFTMDYGVDDWAVEFMGRFIGVMNPVVGVVMGVL